MGLTTNGQLLLRKESKEGMDVPVVLVKEYR